jgi:hypothetical protein
LASPKAPTFGSAGPLKIKIQRDIIICEICEIRVRFINLYSV